MIYRRYWVLLCSGTWSSSCSWMGWGEVCIAALIVYAFCWGSFCIGGWRSGVIYASGPFLLC